MSYSFRLSRCAIKRPSQVERTSVFRNLCLSALLDCCGLESSDDALSVEVLQLVVLWHEVGQHPSKLLNLRCQFKLFHKSIGVLFELLWLNLLVSVDKVDALIQVPNLLAALLILASFVGSQILKQSLSGQLCERCCEDV